MAASWTLVSFGLISVFRRLRTGLLPRWMFFSKTRSRHGSFRRRRLILALRPCPRSQRTIVSGRNEDRLYDLSSAQEDVGLVSSISLSSSCNSLQLSKRAPKFCSRSEWKNHLISQIIDKSTKHPRPSFRSRTKKDLFSLRWHEVYPYRRHAQPHPVYCVVTGCMSILLLANKVSLCNGFHGVASHSSYLIVGDKNAQSSCILMLPYANR